MSSKWTIVRRGLMIAFAPARRNPVVFPRSSRLFIIFFIPVLLAHVETKQPTAKEGAGDSWEAESNAKRGPGRKRLKVRSGAGCP